MDLPNNNMVILQNLKKNTVINNRIFDRNFPSNDLNMNFSFRPVQTKYTHMPTVDIQPKPTVELKNNGIYDVSNTFYPGDRKPDFCGFANNVDKESSLRNQFFALQKADQAKWVPDSTSDLYQNNINFINTNNNLDALDLFARQEFNDFNPNISNTIGNDLFYNSTRVQLKNL
jgi:hypothetical protein